VPRCGVQWESLESVEDVVDDVLLHAQERPWTCQQARVQQLVRDERNAQVSGRDEFSSLPLTEASEYKLCPFGMARFRTRGRGNKKTGPIRSDRRDQPCGRITPQLPGQGASGGSIGSVKES
jgi:hypothetical protein